MMDMSNADAMTMKNNFKIKCPECLALSSYASKDCKMCNGTGQINSEISAREIATTHNRLEVDYEDKMLDEVNQENINIEKDYFMVLFDSFAGITSAAAFSANSKQRQALDRGIFQMAPLCSAFCLIFKRIRKDMDCRCS